jgi:hypothetical protein
VFVEIRFDFFPERQENQFRQLKALFAEGDADNRYAQY